MNAHARTLRRRNLPGTLGPDASWARQSLGALGAYWAATDPRSAALLTFTAFASAIVAGGLHAPARLVEITLALGLCSLGARAVANYVDRDIDALMERTRRRPLPSGAIPATHALTLGLVLLAAGLLVSATFGALVVALIVAGLADNLVVYAVLTKRTSPWSIVVGAPSGGAPALVGYVALAGKIDLMALFLLAFVVCWTPIHIWSLAIRSTDDYARAKVPMLPVTSGVRRGAQAVGVASFLLGACSVLFVLADSTRLVLVVTVAVVLLAVGLLLGSLWLLRAPTAARAWRLFRFTAPYLALLFALLAVNALMAG